MYWPQNELSPPVAVPRPGFDGTFHRALVRLPFTESLPANGELYTSESPGMTPSPPPVLPLLRPFFTSAVVVSNPVEPGEIASLNGNVSPIRSQKNVLRPGFALPRTNPMRMLSQYEPSV